MKGLFQRSLRVKLAVFVAGLLVLTTSLLGVVGYNVARDILLKQIHARLSVVRADRENMLGDYVAHQQQLVELVAAHPRMRDLLDAFKGGRLAEAPFREQAKPVLTDALSTCRSFQALWVTDAQGRAIAATADNFLWKEFAPTPEFREGRQRPYTGVIAPTGGDYQVVAVAPCRDATGQLLGVVMALVSARDIVAQIADATGLGRTGDVMVGRHEGSRVGYVVPSRFETGTSWKELADVPAMAAALRGETGFLRLRNAGGQEVLAAYGPAGHQGWGMVVKIDLDEAYRPIVWLRVLFGGLGVALLLMGGWSSYELARRFTEPILHLSQMAETLAGGSLDARLDVRSKDELGKLGQSFNRMAEALAQSYGALEQRVRERTAALAQERHLLQSLMDHLPDAIYFKDRASRFLRINKALARRFGIRDAAQAVGKSDFDFFTKEHAAGAQADEQQVMATGQGLTGKEEKETWPDGHETWVSSTKVPFRDEAGHIVGSFGISHDITDRKRAEQQLALYTRELAAKNRQIEEDLAMAREVQQAFLPRHYPVFPRGVTPEQSTLRFCHRYLPASSLAGDFFEVLPLSSQTVGVFICDVMGHGVRAALVMAVIRGLVDELQADAGDPSRFLHEINQALLAHWDVAQTTVFASACYLTVDAGSGQLQCAMAGHPSPIWLRRGASRAESLWSDNLRQGPVLGLLPDATYPTIRRELAVGDSVLLFTDGLYEVESPDGESFGQERLRALVEQELRLPCDQLQERLLAEAQHFSATGELTDDVCLVAVHYARQLEPGSTAVSHDI